MKTLFNIVERRLSKELNVEVLIRRESSWHIGEQYTTHKYMIDPQTIFNGIRVNNLEELLNVKASEFVESEY